MLHSFGSASFPAALVARMRSTCALHRPLFNQPQQQLLASCLNFMLRLKLAHYSLNSLPASTTKDMKYGERYAKGRKNKTHDEQEACEGHICQGYVSLRLHFERFITVKHPRGINKVATPDNVSSIIDCDRAVNLPTAICRD